MSPAELAAIAAAASQSGEVIPAFDFTAPVAPTVFAGFSFNAKAGL
jgi:hypothetical protein